MTKEDKNGLVFLGCIGAMLLVPVAAAFDGYVLSLLWGWFVVPVFHIPSIHVVQAIGIAMVVRTLTNQEMPTDKTKEWWEPLLATAMKPIAAIGIGSIVKAFL